MSNCSICGKRHPNPFDNSCIQRRNDENNKLRQVVEREMKKYESYKDVNPSYDYDIYHFCEYLLNEAKI